MNRRRDGLAGAITAISVLAAAWAVAVWLNGGVRWSIGAVRVSSNSAWRPLAVAAVLLGVGIWLRGPAGFASWLGALGSDSWKTRAAIGLAMAVAAVSLTFQSWTASGPDSFGYVSQAALWRSGRLDIPVPLAQTAPWPDALQTFVPFGYSSARDGSAAIVPMTAPAVPMLMALAQTVVGHAGAFLITPVAAAVLVFATFAIGRRVSSTGVGLAAAWLVATSPAFLFMLMWPMSDIPAAALAAIALLLVIRPAVNAAFLAGLAASAGILARPNFVVIAAAILVWLAAERRLMRGDPHPPSRLRIVAFAAALAPGLLTLAWLNTRWFGAPWASGYANPESLLSLTRIGTNALNYLQWLMQTSPLAISGLAMLAVPLSKGWWRAGGPRTAWLLSLATAGACSVYLIYLTYDVWWYLRFLLPAWPAIFLAASIGLDEFSRRSRVVGIAVSAIVLAAGIGGVAFAKSHSVFGIGDVERRYATIARLVAEATQPGAVILTGEHAGTLRYYAGRETLRYDFLDSAWLDRSLAWLAAQGRRPYILVEDWEQPRFEAKFGSTNREGRLAYSPVLAWQSTHAAGWVYLYDPSRKDAITHHPGAEAEAGAPLMAPLRGFPQPDR